MKPFWQESKSSNPFARVRRGVAAYLETMSIESDLELDVVIPAAEKDADVLPFAIDGVRRHLRHPIHGILVIAPDREVLRAVCRRKRCTFVDERALLRITAADIGLIIEGHDRSAWIYQQLLKWNADTITACPQYLILDSDTVLIRPQTYERAGRILMNYSDEYNLPYFQMYERLLQDRAAWPISFTSHQMLYDKAALREMKARIEAIHGVAWVEAILSNLDRTQEAGFSDYDTYGHHFLSHFPEKVAMEHWANLSLERRRNLTSVSWLRLKYGSKFKSISFHHYKT